MVWAPVDARAVQEAVELRSALSSKQADGIEILIIISTLSLTAVVFLLVVILLAALREKYYKSGSGIFRSHVTAYLVSLLVSDLLQAIGSIMNSKWVQSMAVSLGGFCSAQGAIKQAADVGTALWISIIAVHTFNVLVLGIHIRRVFMYIVLVGSWSFIGTIVTIGPFILQEPSRGPYFGISGYWCWISKSYETEQFVLEYMIMFISAVASFVLYMLVFLRLRGNLLVVPGGRVRLRSVDRNTAWTLRRSYEASDLQAHVVSIAKHMLLYPVAYTVLIVPIAACRFSEWTGHEVPLGAVIFSDSVFLLSGFVNTSLFVLTGRVLPLTEILAIFRTPLLKPGIQALTVDSKASVAREWDCETTAAYGSSLTLTDKLERGFEIEKDLPRIPQETHSVAIQAPHTLSFGRKNSELVLHSETSSLIGRDR